MKSPVVLVDTNVLVSGLITRDALAPVSRILDGMLCAAFVFLLSPDLLQEYRDVLLRPKIQKFHGLDDHQIDRLLTEIVTNALWREPGVSPMVAPDRGDDHVWALLSAYPGAVLVTGDRLLVENPPPFASVMTPKSFVETFHPPR